MKRLMLAIAVAVALAAAGQPALAGHGGHGGHGFHGPPAHRAAYYGGHHGHSCYAPRRVYYAPPPYVYRPGVRVYYSPYSYAVGYQSRGFSFFFGG